MLPAKYGTPIMVIVIMGHNTPIVFMPMLGTLAPINYTNCMQKLVQMMTLSKTAGFQN